MNSQELFEKLFLCECYTLYQKILPVTLKSDTSSSALLRYIDLIIT